MNKANQFCSHCGSQLPENAKFCTNCGAPIPVQAEPVEKETYSAEPVYHDVSQQAREPSPSVGVVEALTSFVQNITNFSGRARRSEYWWVVLVLSIASTLLGNLLPDLEDIIRIVIGLSQIPLLVRRLHDTGKKWTYALFELIPLVGTLIVLIQCARDSDPGPNQFGPSPKYN